ncbi:MAG: hypothetical protein ABIF40_02965 [archaeon]
MVEKQVPTQEVLNLKQKGLSEDEIFASLQRKGYSGESIQDAMAQGDVKIGVEQAFESQPNIPQNEQPSEQMQFSAMDQPNDEFPVPIPVTDSKAYPGSQPEQVQQAPVSVFPQEQGVAPASPVIPPQAGGMSDRSMEEVQSLVEEIIEDKWRDLLSSMGDIGTWKTQVTEDSEAMKQEILRLRQAFENLQTAVVGKVQEYNKSIKNVNSEMQALELVFQKILEPLTTNIKDLNKVTQELKNRK